VTTPRSHRRRRVLVTAGVFAVACAGAVLVPADPLGLGLSPWPAAAASASDDEAPPITTEVVWAALIDHLRLNGALDYGAATALPAPDGTVTALPAPGAVIGHGEQVLEVDGLPVVLFHGERPFWRALDTSSSRGEDVRQLEANLAAFGFLDGEPDDRFDWRTREAVRRWQRALREQAPGSR